MPNVSDLKVSKYLTKHDVDPPILLTIKGYKKVNVAPDGNDPDVKYTLTFQENDKPLVLNVTNGNIIAGFLGSEDFDDWIGHKIVLYNDPTISFGGKLTGGIRVRAPKNQAKPTQAQAQRQQQAPPPPPPTDEQWVDENGVQFEPPF